MRAAALVVLCTPFGWWLVGRYRSECSSSIYKFNKSVIIKSSMIILDSTDCCLVSVQISSPSFASTLSQFYISYIKSFCHFLSLPLY